MKQLTIVLLLSMHSIYGMKGGRKRSNSTNSSPQLQRHDSENILSHSDPLSTHVKNHDSLKDLYKNLNQIVIEQGSKIDTLQTKIISLEIKLSRLSIINNIFVTSLIVTASGLTWYKWSTILALLRNQ